MSKKKPEPAAPRFEQPKPLVKPKRIQIAQLLDSQGSTIEALFTQTLENIGAALTANKTQLNRMGEAITIGPDYAIRLDAVRCLHQLCLRSRKIVPEPEVQGPKRLTLGEFREALKEHLPEYAAIFSS